MPRLDAVHGLVSFTLNGNVRQTVGGFGEPIHGLLSNVSRRTAPKRVDHRHPLRIRLRLPVQGDPKGDRRSKVIVVVERDIGGKALRPMGLDANSPPVRVLRGVGVKMVDPAHQTGLCIQDLGEHQADFGIAAGHRFLESDDKPVADELGFERTSLVVGQVDVAANVDPVAQRVDSDGSLSERVLVRVPIVEVSVEAEDTIAQRVVVPITQADVRAEITPVIQERLHIGEEQLRSVALPDRQEHAQASKAVLVPDAVTDIVTNRVANRESAARLVNRKGEVLALRHVGEC